MTIADFQVVLSVSQVTAKALCWQEHPLSASAFSFPQWGGPPQPASLTGFGNLKGDATQERLERERPRAPLPACHGLAVARAHLLTLDTPHNQILQGPSPDVLGALRFMLPLRAPGQDILQLIIPLLAEAAIDFTAHTLRVFICKMGRQPCLFSQPSVCEDEPHKGSQGAAWHSGLNISEKQIQPGSKPGTPSCLSSFI